MLMLQGHHRLFFSTSPFLLSLRRQPFQSISLPFSLHRPASVFSLSALPADQTEPPSRPSMDIAEAEEEEGPVELPPQQSMFPSVPSIFATDDDPTPLQTATSVLLTGAVSIYLFRALRRRANRSKELKFRSTGVKKSLKEEAMESLKAMGSASIETNKSSSSSPAQAFLGAIAAGVIALILYKFTLTIEAALNRQTISDSYSVRQITITVRTIINGICYLATFVFGLNSVGLFLYACQLLFNSFMEDSDSDPAASKEKSSEAASMDSSAKSLADETESNTPKND